MMLNKVSNTKKIIKTTLSIGGLLFSVSMIYLFFLNGINQAYLIGTVGFFLVMHAAIMLSKHKEISVPLMVSSYNLAMCFIFLSWVGLFAVNNYIPGVITLIIFAAISGVAAYFSKKQK